MSAACWFRSLRCGALCVIKALPSIVADEFNKLQFRTLLKRINVSSTQEEAKPIVKVDQIVINTVDKLQDIVNKLRHSDLFSIYIDEHLYIADSATVEYKVELTNNFLSGITLEQALEILSSILASDISKCVYDSKHLKHLLLKQNKQINNIKYDISIMQYIVEYRSFKDFEALISNYNLSKYASSLISLSEILLAKLTADNEIKLYSDIELPLMQVLYQMEVDGVKVDKTILNELGNRFCDEISVLSKEIYELSGVVFNIASPKQLGEVLFEKLSLPTSKKTKSGFSTDADVLAKLVDVHPIVPLVIKVRQLNKLYGTYIEGIRQLITKESLVHTTYNQTLTSTGRLSSSDPNMQNIPIRDEVGREIRKMFVPRYDLLISADYSQIELRLLAHFSQDEVLIETFNNGVDIHSRVASEIFNVPIELINANMRRAAKAVNFGIIYGISQYGLSQNIGITFSQASKYISKYFESYPKIKAYLNSSVSDAKRDGFITTITGRRRQIPELKSANAQIRAFGERAAMNMPLQGSAADIIKIAMINVSKALKSNKLQSKLIMQVHDELVIDTVESEKEKVQNILKYEMQNAIKTRVVLEVNVSSGVNLFDAK